ncbi:EF-hand calcium-binding domain-containing protein 6-like [Epinephelus fuscoguttatus]|uniref:EF-hand calcium-binding domain-containing protein 6-like n=1 Tax=Epinephelus fuscoguttatus TaxID=293821 RepID=UPI0020D1E159|nr:EF-hand calcium-binding domain-containing protein 6-like [Epinephelus fuscoguttatus]
MDPSTSFETEEVENDGPQAYNYEPARHPRDQEQIRIGGNLRTVIRVFSLFDYNSEGHIQQHEFRRILDNYCIHLTDKEFQRLWNHYSPNNTSTISYEVFLDKLGFGGSHYLRIAPICTKLEMSSRGTTPSEKVKQRKQKPESVSSLCDAPSVLQHRKLQTLFYDKMCMNSTPVWQALQAFDTTRSGLVEQDVLRAILSSFIFPMNPHSFQKLTSRYGVGAMGQVRWKHFMGHFIIPVKKEGDTNLHTIRASEQPVQENILDLQDTYSHLKEIFHLLDMREVGWITRADMRHLLERTGRTWPRARRSQITELLNELDPEHTGVIQLANLKRLNPSSTNTEPQPSIATTAEPLDGPEETAEEQKAPDERQTTQCADKLSVASASWTTVENVLVDKLCEQLGPLLASLKLCDPQHTGYITQEDLKKVLSCHGVPISDTHFNKLCETSSSRPGSSSKLVSYTGFLRNLGVPLTDETYPSSLQEEGNHTESRCTSPKSSLQSAREQRPAFSLQVTSDTFNILDIVFQRMRSRLEQRNSSLTDRIQAITHSSEGMLTETDVHKPEAQWNLSFFLFFCPQILEDSWVILDDRNFQKFTELLGFRDGQIERSVFLVKYEEATGRDRQQCSEGHGDKEEVNPLLTAEQCLAVMKTRIKIIHGDNQTAFRLMDRNRKGVVDCRDFKVLYSSLGFFCREGEYDRLLDLIGLHPGANLNYAEFVGVVENNGKRKPGPQTACVQEQLHELLACEARYKWADMSKVLCQFDTDNQGWIHKESLRGLLFTYALPMRPDEFDQLWLRYDPDGRGCVAVCDFLEKLGFHHEGEVTAQSQKLNQTVDQQNAGRPLSSDTASLQCMKLKVSMDDSCKRLAYMDFLSAFGQKNCERPPATPNAVRQIESLDSLSPGKALARMQELVTASAPHLWRVFLAFDQSGTGTVKALEFRQVLENFCAHLSDKQYRYMLTKLELDRESCTVNWKDFLNRFQSQSPLMFERSLSKNWEQRAKTRSPIWAKTSETTECLQQIQEVVSGYLYDITKELMDLDPSISMTISKEQFRQLCDCHCLRLTNDQKFNSSLLIIIDCVRELVICKANLRDVYCGTLFGVPVPPVHRIIMCASVCVFPFASQFECVSQMPVNEQEKLQYREFLKLFGALDRTEAEGPFNSVQSPSSEPRDTPSATECFPETAAAVLQRTKSAPQCCSRRPASVGRPGTGSPLGSRERRLRWAVQCCWKEILRKCTEEDPQREGHISTTSFLEILQSFNISVTQEQFEHLAVKSDIINDGCVSYNNFLRHFLLNLKPAEAKMPFRRCKLPPPVMTTSQGVLSRDCVEVMLRIHDVVCSSWTSIRRCFLTSDRTRAGSVSVQDFRKVLHHFSIKLSEEEFFHLSSYFDADTTGRICYNNFLWAFLH